MRIRVTCCRVFESIASIWVVPLLVSLVVSLALCTAIGTKTTILPIDVLLSLSRDMLNLLGVIAAILIAVITTMYVLSAQTRGEGFRSFLLALDGLRGMPAKIRSSREALDLDNDGSPARLTDVADTLDEFVAGLDEVKPTWQGFEADRDLETVMAYYSGGIKAELESIASTLEGADNLQVDQLAKRFDGRVRSMVVGLLTIQLGIVGKQFVERLLKLSLSLIPIRHDRAIIHRCVPEPHPSFPRKRQSTAIGERDCGVIKAKWYYMLAGTVFVSACVD